MSNTYLISMNELEKIIDTLELKQLIDAQLKIDQRIKQKIEKLEMSPLEVAMLKHKVIKQQAICTK